MLFAVKNRLAPTLLLIVVLAGGSMLLRAPLQLTGDLAVSPMLPVWVCGALLCLVASDAVLHALLFVTLRERYLCRYRALAEYFHPQRLREVFAGGLLAGLGEELFFRGVVLAGLGHIAGWPPTAAVAVTAALFAVAHWLPNRKLAPFAVWAALQGAWIGALYVASGSLVVCMVTHAFHDILGFTVFAIQRRTGWGMRWGGRSGT